HPEVDRAHRGDALLDDQARLDDRLEGEAVGQVLGRLRLALELRLAVLVEAVAAALRAQLALLDQALHAAVDVEALAVGLAQVLGDVEDRVEPQQVAEHERSHRRQVLRRDALVDLLDRYPPSSWARHTSPTAEVSMRLTTKPGTSAQVIGCLRIAWAKLIAASIVSGDVSSPSTISSSGITEAG